MEKFLITGFSGFVSQHFLAYLYDNNMKAEIYGIDIYEPKFDYSKYKDVLKINFQAVDLLDVNKLRNVFLQFIPDFVLHLASFSSVAYSWRYPSESFSNNTNIFLNLVTTVREFNHKCRILSVGSSEEYGNVVKEDLPLSETHTLNPISPYAVARVSQEMLSKVFVESYHMDIILTRSFNHIGPFQSNLFVVPSFINQARKIKESKEKKGCIETGDISIIRDFVDVRDVVRAYYLLLKKGKCGEIYNICSGKGISLENIIKMIAEQLGVSIETVINQEFIRPNDNKIIIGNPQKIKEEIGWIPEITLEQTIQDMILSKN